MDAVQRPSPWRESRGWSPRKLLGFKEQNQHFEAAFLFLWFFFSLFYLFFLPSVIFSGSGTPTLPWTLKPWALAGKVRGSLCGGLATLSHQHYKVSSLAQLPVKRRWAPLDALKSVLTRFTFHITFEVTLFYFWPYKLEVHIQILLTDYKVLYNTVLLWVRQVRVP